MSDDEAMGDDEDEDEVDEEAENFRYNRPKGTKIWKSHNSLKGIKSWKMSHKISRSR